MAVLSCFGWACERLISVSSLPGGNPVAAAEPEHWATQYFFCRECGEAFCDRCATSRRGRTLSVVKSCGSCGGRLDRARPGQQASDRPVSDAAAYYRRGKALGEADRADRALTAFDEAVRLRPGYAAAHFHRGIALRDLGRLTEALDAFAEAHRRDPAHVQAMFERGNVFLKLRQPENAVEAYAQAVRIEPRYVEALINKGVTLSNLEQPAEALADLDEAVRLHAANEAVGGTHALGYAYGARGAALTKLGRYEEAVTAIDTAISIGPDLADNYRNKAYALERLGRLEEARITRRLYEDTRRREGE
ncbi:tetratricopeptide repeat protein [Streptomyces sp. NPDC006332]|uniref:tetratricopeptide repeat protein n=1 Tax=Streptomyces sp. NPDC006332 TaxID=3155456 RepID=UPI0033B921C6